MARAVLAYAFGGLGLHRVTAHHMAWNGASGRVLEKAGMRREGVLCEHIRKNGRFVDAVAGGSVSMADAIYVFDFGNDRGRQDSTAASSSFVVVAALIGSITSDDASNNDNDSSS